MDNYIIDISHLNYKIIDKKNEYIILKDVNFKVTRGEFIAITGTSGSGKTTLLNIISGIKSYDNGNVLLFNKDLKQMTLKEKTSLRKNKVGFVFQFFNLINELTVYENIELALVIAGNNDKLKVKEVFKLVKMGQYANRYPSQLSGGQQQRIAIARALVNNPDIILADEPTGNLDETSSKEIMELFYSINKHLGVTILMITHNLSLVQYTDRQIKISEGKIIYDEKHI